MQGPCKNHAHVGGNQPPHQEKLRSRLQASLSKVATLVVDDPVYIPVFERLENELEALAKQNDTLTRARMIALQSEMS